MKEQKKQQVQSNEKDEEPETLRPTDGSPVGPRDLGVQIHSDQSDAESRPKANAARDPDREDLPPAGRGVRADRAGRDSTDGVERPTSPGDLTDPSEAQEEDSSPGRKTPGQERAVAKDDEKGRPRTA